MFIRKLQRLEVKDVGNGVVDAVMSAESKDRDGDIIRQAGWDLDDFMKHPVLVASHDYYNLINQIGEWKDVAVRGKQLRGKAEYYIGDGNEQADWGYKLAQKGRAAFSVGFIPDMDKAVKMDKDSFFGGWEFNGQKLLETSQVVIPANPDALQRMKAVGLHPVLEGVVEEELKELLKNAPPPDGTTEKLIELLEYFKDIEGLADKIALRIIDQFGYEITEEGCKPKPKKILPVESIREMIDNAFKTERSRN